MQEIREQVKKIIQDLFGLDFEPEITISPANIEADFSTNAPLKLAKEFHKSPMEIANELASPLGSVLETSISAPGFLNFTLSDDYLNNTITQLSEDFDTAIKNDKYNGKTHCKPQQTGTQYTFPLQAGNMLVKKFFAIHFLLL